MRAEHLAADLSGPPRTSIGNEAVCVITLTFEGLNLPR